jgi:hypothetical protein
MRKLVLLLLLVPSFLFGQTSRKDSIWLPLKPFIGEWSGEGGGGPGQGKYERSYQSVLNKNFIEIRNKSTFQPTDKNPKGEVHEDLGYFSYDKGLKKFKLRQYHIEGFVNEYVLDSISPNKKTLVFLTYEIENIPKGFKAKETYRILSENEIEETFELAEPGKPFEIYSKVLLKRKN